MLGLVALLHELFGSLVSVDVSNPAGREKVGLLSWFKLDALPR